jgi:predicted transcriptional regulator
MYGLTPQTYREKWNLAADYPMTAPAYSARRSELARSIGLGASRVKAAATKAAPAPEPAKAPAKARRKKTDA